MKKCLVVYNPNSGKYNKEDTLPKLRKILEEYNYENISESTHVTHLWEPLKFTLKDNYRYISKSKTFSFFSNLIAAIIFPILIILNKILFGFKIENKDIKFRVQIHLDEV